MVVVPPAVSPLEAIVAACGDGPALVVMPSVERAAAMGAALARRGLRVAVVPREWARAAAGVDVVVGARAAAWAPCPGLATAIVVDEHDESLQEERAPTWHARDVLVERARRAGAPGGGDVAVPDRDRRRRGRWCAVAVPGVVGARRVADRRGGRPRRRGAVEDLAGDAARSSPRCGHRDARGRVRAQHPRPGPDPRLPRLSGAAALRDVRRGGRPGRRRPRCAAPAAEPLARPSARCAGAPRSPTCAPGSPACARSWRRPPDGRWWPSPAATTRRLPTPRCTSAPKRCCTASSEPTWWRSSMSTTSCSPRGTGRPSRR